MQEEYSIFRRFPTLELAVEIKGLLENNNIDVILDDNVPPVDVTFSGSTIQHKIELRIAEENFNRAEEILEQHSNAVLDDIDKDYYLFSFNNEELYDVLLKSDEWSSLDYMLAQKVLKERGQSIDKELLTSLKKQRLEELAQPDKNQGPWIIAGYIFSFLGGFLGLIIGYFLWTSKKTLPNGQKVDSYSLSDRKHGKRIFYIGVIIAPIVLLMKILSYF
ncbi:hypothetical protein FNJ87_15295 [Nonlabens mediterrranea]|uniref:DUF2007 domain-containing protein n=1 Tax=Nonlabens mediterrranea TaxID=1419947 RepID=A0ABS0A944_9FLAO|nr:hypothetical protein [Nonlabens mediterrranea]